MAIESLEVLNWFYRKLTEINNAQWIIMQHVSYPHYKPILSRFCVMYYVNTGKEIN